MKTPRFLTEYAAYVRREVQTMNVSGHDKALAERRIAGVVIKYGHGLVTLPEAMNDITSTYQTLWLYSEGDHDDDDV